VRKIFQEKSFLEIIFSIRRLFFWSLEKSLYGGSTVATKATNFKKSYKKAKIAKKAKYSYSLGPNYGCCLTIATHGNFHI
jgi:hypothetical protein